MERVSLFCAATMILTLFCCKNPSREGAVPAFLALWKNGDRDIPILKRAKAEYARCNNTKRSPNTARLVCTETVN